MGVVAASKIARLVGIPGGSPSLTRSTEIRPGPLVAPRTQMNCRRCHRRKSELVSAGGNAPSTLAIGIRAKAAIAVCETGYEPPCRFAGFVFHQNQSIRKV